ncbi:MAG: HAD domain-containing protein [Candidatus Coprovivens sp.]
MKVIFLDFNGVLDTWFDMDNINYDNLQRLKWIVDETDAKVVISSSIKRNYVRTGVMGGILLKLVNCLLDEGIDVIGVTPNAETREYEIMMYLHDHPEIDNYVILDDDYDMERLSEHLVKLPPQSIGQNQLGLQKHYAEAAIAILKNDFKR